MATSMGTALNAYFITGTSGGLGKALAMELLKERDNRIFGISRTCTITHSAYRHFHLDLRDTEAVGKFTFRLPDGAKRATLINNAGVITPVAPVGRLDHQDLKAGFSVNLIGPSILMNQFIRSTSNPSVERMIVNISSGAARHPIDSWAVYCACKAGLDMFSRVLQSEQPFHHAKHPVRIFSIAPGVVDTGMQKQIRSVSRKDFAGKDRFVELKTSGALAPADQTARSLIKIMGHPEKYPDVCLDIRNLPE